MTAVDKDVLEKSFARAGNALMQLEKGAAIDLTDPSLQRPMLIRDGVIQRFEFCYELMWKLFRKLHLLRGTNSDKVRRAYDCIAEAGAAGWLKDHTLWEQMIRDRNFTSHEYDENAADVIYQRVRDQYYPEMQRAYDHIKAKYLDGSQFDEWKDRDE